MADIDAELADLVQEQSSVGADGHVALEVRFQESYSNKSSIDR